MGSRLEGLEGQGGKGQKQNHFSGTVLLVGNFLSASGGSRGVCEELALRLSGAGWTVFTTSSQPRRLLRLWDMLRTAYGRRLEYAVAQVDVYSGPAFVWAELA